MLEEQLRDAGRELRAVTDSYVRDVSSRDGVANVQRRLLVRRRRRQVAVGVAAALVVIAASAGVLAATRSGPGEVVTAEPAPELDDRTAIEATIKNMFERKHTVEEGLALIDESDGLAGVMEAAQADPRAALTLTIVVRSIDLAGERATAHVDYYLSGKLAATSPEISLVKKDGRWLITRAGYCLVVSAAVQCPPPGEQFVPTTTTTVANEPGAVGPTQEEIATVMRSTTLEASPDRYFVPYDTPVTISDGAGGTLTAVIGGHANSADGGGQLVFFWHDDAFLGWDKDHEGFKLRLSAESATGPAFRVSYLYMRDGEAACCATGTVDVVYAWDGLKIVPDRDLPPETAGAKVRIAG